jgi:Zn-dependent protease
MTLNTFAFKGVRLKLHWSFLALFLIAPAISYFKDGTILDTIILLSIVFTSLILHEYGHALAAKYFKVDIDEIIIYFFGGAAVIQEDVIGKKEFWITFWGPFVNFVLAILSFAISVIFVPIDSFLSEILLDITTVNIILLLFNLIPAWPMDGGRLLRSLLSLKFNRIQTIKISVTISQILCIIVPILFFVFDGFSFNAIIIFGVLLVYTHFYKKDEIKKEKEKNDKEEIEKGIRILRTQLLKQIKDGSIPPNLIHNNFVRLEIEGSIININVVDENPLYYIEN